jgi:glycosyltransferase involved in cell wall biosynthesis
MAEPAAPLRALLVLDSLAGGGTERSTALLAPALADHGVRPVVVCLWDRAGDRARLEADGVTVLVLPEGSLPAKARALRALVRSSTPDLVHSALLQADLVSRAAVVGTGVPLLTSLVNTPYGAARRDDPAVGTATLAAVRLADAVSARLTRTWFHAVTPGVAAHARRHLRADPDRLRVVERGRDLDALGRRTPERRAAARAALGLTDADRLVLAVGRHTHQKGFDRLVAAVPRLAERVPTVRVVVAGPPGAATPRLERLVDASGASDHIELVGPRDDVAELLCAADVVVLPSRYEGTAGVVLEAWALEAPVVGADVEGMAGLLVDDVDAVVVDAADPAALADGVIRLLEDPERAGRLTRAGRSLVEDRFALDDSARRMAELYREVVGAGPRRSHGADDPGDRAPHRSSPSVVPSLPRPRPTRISVVVPARDAEATIGAQLEALAGQDDPGIPWEVVVADNGSGDATVATVRARAAELPGLPAVVVVDAATVRGASHARNVGAAAATGDLLCFCDADDVVDPGWLRAHVEAAPDHHLAGGALDVDTINDPRVRSWRPTPRAADPDAEQRFAPSGNLAVWADVYRLLGGFDEAYPKSHDVELSRRAEALGLVRGWVPGALVHYRLRSTLGGLARQSWRGGRAGVQMARDFPDQLPPVGPRQVAAGWASALRAAPGLATDRRRGAAVRVLAAQGGATAAWIRPAGRRRRRSGDAR